MLICKITHKFNVNSYYKSESKFAGIFSGFAADHSRKMNKIAASAKSIMPPK